MKYFPLPDGHTVEVPDNMSYAEAETLAQKRFPELYRPAEAPPETGFVPAFKSGLHGLAGDAAAFAGRTGLMDTAAAEKFRKEQEEASAKVYKPTEKGWTEDPWTKIKELAGSSAAYMAAPAIAGVAGAGAAALAPELAGAALLSSGAAGLTSALQFTGSNLSRQVQEGKALKDTDLLAAGAAAVPQAALDVFSLHMIPGLGKLFGNAGVKLSEEQLKAMAQQGLKKTLGEYALKTGKTAGMEGLTEAGQQVFERMQAGLSITDPQARQEYFDNFIGGAVLGGAMAIPGHKIEKMQAVSAAENEISKKKLAEQQKVVDDQKSLLDIYDQHQEAKGKLKELREALAATALPETGATPEQIAANKAARDALSAYNKNTAKPLRDKYKANQAEIDEIVAERKRQAKEEQKQAGKPAAPTTTAPSIDPNAEVETGEANVGVDTGATGTGDGMAGAASEQGAAGVGVPDQSGVGANQPPAGGVAGGAGESAAPLEDVPDFTPPPTPPAPPPEAPPIAEATPPVALTKPKKPKKPTAASDLDELDALLAEPTGPKAARKSGVARLVDTLTKATTRTEEEKDRLSKFSRFANQYGVHIEEGEPLTKYEKRLRATIAAAKDWHEWNKPPAKEGEEEGGGARPPVDKNKSDEEIKAEEAHAAELYNKHRESFRLQPALDFLKAIKNRALPSGMKWESNELAAFLDTYGIEEPEFSTHYKERDKVGNIRNPYRDKAEEAKALNNIIKQLREHIKENKERNVLEPWGPKLTRDQKDVFLSHIAHGTKTEVINALHKLHSYTQAIHEAQGRPTDRKADPAAGIYERNRQAQSKVDKVDYPSWDKLSEDQRTVFKEAILLNMRERAEAGDEVVKKHLKENKSEAGQLRGATAEDHTAAFQEIAHRLPTVDTTVKTGKETGAALAKREFERRKALYEEREKNREKPEYNSLNYREEPKKPKRLPAAIVNAIKEGNTQVVLKYMANASDNVSYRVIARLAMATGINSKIKFVDKFPDGRVAEYDPATDTISIAADGLEEKFVLHEMIHAVSLRVIDKYLQGKSGLTQDQQDACEHLESIMERAKEELSKQHKTGFAHKSWSAAFDDLHEFVSYAMTDTAFQEELKNIKTEFSTAGANETTVQRGQPIKPEPLVDTALPEQKSLWSQFAHSVAKLLGMFKPEAQKLFDKSGRNISTNLMAETLSVFEDILTPSRADETTTGPLAARATATGLAPRTAEQIVGSVKVGRSADKASFLDWVKSPKFGQNMIRIFQNAQRPIMDVERRADRLNLIHHIGNKINNVWTQITNSSGKSWQIFKYRLAGLENDVHQQVKDFMAAYKIDTEKALQVIHTYLLYLHEPERRAVKFLRDVPLDDVNKSAIKIGNKLYSAAQARKEIFSSLDHPATTPAAAKSYRKMLDKIVDPTIKNNPNYAKHDAKGVPLTKEQKALYFNKDSSKYDVSVLTHDEHETLKKYFDPKSSEYSIPQLDAIAKSLQKYQEATNSINKEANYWSPGVENRVAFNGWEHYVPLKGRADQDEKDFDLDPHKVGGDLQEKDYAFGGRKSESENALLQTLADGARSALRLGRSDLTLSIKNAVNDGILKGDAKKRISFEERMKNPDEFKRETSGEKIVLHYETNGDITVIKLDSGREAEAIRRTYRESNPLIEKANAITSSIGQLHTRFNLAFTPMNFVRDALTNAYTLGAEFGPEKSAQLLGEVASQVAKNGIYKASKVATLLSQNKIAEVEAYAAAQLAKGDSFVHDMLDYLKAGGRVSYLQGIAAKGKLNELMKEVKANGPILKSKESITNFFDIYTDMFELASRTASYRVLSKIYLDEAAGKGLAGKEAAEYAKVRATETAKNFANFEQVGEWGKQMGAMFMFFRPAATGAVRAIDSLRPAFDMLKSSAAIEERIRAEAYGTKATEKDIQAAIAKTNKQARSTAAMTAGLLGMGFMTYMMSQMMADDDEAGRNKVATDDSVRWSRYARFFVFGNENAIQLPWGFGLGAFASMGAQVAAMASGNSKPTEALSNIIGSSLDTFLPLPISRMSPLDTPIQFIIDSAVPSAFRPLVEYAMNKDGLGRDIYNNRQGMGTAGSPYTGGDNIPQVYKDAATSLFEATGVAVTPNTLYFAASNYVDGLARGVATAYNWKLTLQGKKDFDMRHDTMVLDSFVGAPSNYDSRKFSEAEKKIEGIRARLKTMENNPVGTAAYLEQHPMDMELVQYYNSSVNQELRDVRHIMKTIREDRNMTPKEKKADLDKLQPVQDAIKRNLVSVYAQLGDLDNR